ncbi:MAG: hypothetical protein HN790_05725 [Methylococcales bacterium]|jgi:hypothetical protein|nr:hypothetical protein [Methylococcales bacterium]
MKKNLSDPNTAETTPSSTGPEKKKSKNKSKKNTSLRLDKQTLKALKIHAIENDTSIQKLIEKLIKDYLKKQA